MIRKLHIALKVLIILLFFYLGIIYDRGAAEYADTTRQAYTSNGWPSPL